MNWKQAAAEMINGRECEAESVPGLWTRYRYWHGKFQWFAGGADPWADSAGLPVGEWRFWEAIEPAEPDPPVPAEPELPVPAEGYELWEAYSDEPHGHTLFVCPVGQAHCAEIDTIMGDLESDTRWTGRAWWLSVVEACWVVRGGGSLRVNGKPPDYVEMKING